MSRYVVIVPQMFNSYRLIDACSPEIAKLRIHEIGDVAAFGVEAYIEEFGEARHEYQATLSFDYWQVYLYDQKVTLPKTYNLLEHDWGLFPGSGEEVFLLNTRIETLVTQLSNRIERDRFADVFKLACWARDQMFQLLSTMVNQGGSGKKPKDVVCTLLERALDLEIDAIPRGVSPLKEVEER